VQRIALIQGNPDPHGAHYGHALGGAYAEGAQRGGHSVRTIDVAALEFPWLRTQQEFNSEDVPPAIRAAQQDLIWANHLVIVFPLWHGMLPAVLKAFFEQLLRPGFALQYRPGGFPQRLLTGKSARIIVTMGMPAIAYRTLFGGHGVKALKHSILWGSGIRPVRTCFIGGIADRGPEYHQRWLDQVRRLGERGR
jgi:putative NADPH-quinone reductase